MHEERTNEQLAEALSNVIGHYWYFSGHQQDCFRSKTAETLREIKQLRKKSDNLRNLVAHPSYKWLLLRVSMELSEEMRIDAISSEESGINDALDLIEWQYVDRINQSKIYYVKNGQIKVKFHKRKGDSIWHELLNNLTFIFEQFFQTIKKSIFQGKHPSSGAYYRFMSNSLIMAGHEGIDEETLASYLKRERKKLSAYKSNREDTYQNAAQKKWNF